MPDTADRKLRVFIVDDDPKTCETLTLLIEALGHDATAESDAPRAVESARAFNPDVCLMDLKMPLMSGSEVIRQMLPLPELREVVFIAVTGSAGQGNEAMSEGFSRYFTKPLDVPALDRYLKNLSAARS